MIVALTWARVRSLRELAPFARLSVASVRAALGTPGNHGVRIRPRTPLDWYTVTAWEDEEAMVAFVRGEPHRRAMRATRRLTTETRFARVAMDDGVDGIGWREVYARLDAPADAGAPSRSHPGAA